jgi:hypothetical protein
MLSYQRRVAKPCDYNLCYSMVGDLISRSTITPQIVEFLLGMKT